MLLFTFSLTGAPDTIDALGPRCNSASVWWVSSVPASQARTREWAQGAVEINFKELTPFPHPTDPHSLCEIYLRVIPSEGWVRRRPGAPELRWGASCRGSLLPTMNPPLHCRPPQASALGRWQRMLSSAHVPF
ncbi:Hypothetical predicted protein [Marmota monax]|uniref:Uncharacterized protein n=1 Tax=Marmota monax TaxID=9995 RepID=A0A5E4ADD2_MARMO|nr:hypothetical protein GHT09_020185 [Marmota monax]VTJ55343.1 Hypothetical predicted protein [Marmota monax]